MTGVSAAAEKSGAHYFPQFFPQKIDNIRPLGFDGDSSKKEMENDKKGEVEEEEVEDGSSGTYEIDGCWYLDGKTCEDRLKDGTLCELFHEGGVNEEEGTDEWFPAKIVSSRVIIVPHANTSFKRFTVEYGKDFSKTEKDVGSDRWLGVIIPHCIHHLIFNIAITTRTIVDTLILSSMYLILP